MATYCVGTGVCKGIEEAPMCTDPTKSVLWTPLPFQDKIWEASRPGGAAIRKGD